MYQHRREMIRIRGDVPRYVSLVSRLGGCSYSAWRCRAAWFAAAGQLAARGAGRLGAGRARHLLQLLLGARAAPPVAAQQWAALLQLMHHVPVCTRALHSPHHMCSLLISLCGSLYISPTTLTTAASHKCEREI